MSKLSLAEAKKKVLKLEPVAQYEFISRMFAQLTSYKNHLSGACCLETRDGVPKCCYQLLDNEGQLQITDQEMFVFLTADNVSYQEEGVLPVRDMDEVYRLSITDVDKARESLHTGVLSKTIECVSHPTRPVILDDKVVGVVAVKDCIGEWAIDDLREDAAAFQALWELAVQIYGTKPYYITRGIDDPSKFEWITEPVELPAYQEA